MNVDVFLGVDVLCLMGLVVDYVFVFEGVVCVGGEFGFKRGVELI